MFNPFLGTVEANHAVIVKAQKLLLRLTKALFLYGAPLYRVESTSLDSYAHNHTKFHHVGIITNSLLPLC
jgi:hypothetical protein